MEFRPLGDAGAYPSWIRTLRGKSGVYAIRVSELLFFSRVAYVGESHTGNLYGTLTRHFQRWGRQKRNWWEGQFTPKATDPGHSYDRRNAAVAVLVCGKYEAVDLQAAWIAKLSPRDNVAGVLEDAPF